MREPFGRHHPSEIFAIEFFGSILLDLRSESLRLGAFLGRFDAPHGGYPHDLCLALALAVLLFEEEAFVLRDVRVHALHVAFISRGEQSLEGLLVLGELPLQRDEVLQLLHRGLCLVAHVIQLPALRLLDGGQLTVEE